MRVLAGLTLLLAIADHWTTYLCLQAPVAGWDVVEANPISEWLFEMVGLVPGLLIDSALTLGVVVFLTLTSQLARPLRGGLLAAVAGTTALAVINNLHAISEMGLSPLPQG